MCVCGGGGRYCFLYALGFITDLHQLLSKIHGGSVAQSVECAAFREVASSILAVVTSFPAARVCV